jgi:cytidine deaminase
VVGHDERGAIVLRQKWSRGQVESRRLMHRTKPAMAPCGACRTLSASPGID